MAKLRLFFRKESRAVYISHLDLLRTFQRVFLRQGMVLSHSQGFHPHPIPYLLWNITSFSAFRSDMSSFPPFSLTAGCLRTSSQPT